MPGLEGVLVIGEPTQARTHVRDLLATHRLVHESHFEGAEATIKRQPPAVAVVLLPDTGGSEILRTLCAADRAMYVIAIVAEHLPARTGPSAFAAGCHDVIRAPYTPQDLRARVGAVSRLRRWMGARTQVDLKLAPPVKSAIAGLHAWHSLADVISDDLEAMLARPVTVEEGMPALKGAVQSASIAMTLASESVELGISLAADETTCAWLGANLLGDPAAGKEALDDVLREIANVAGGALKRAALAEGETLTTGMPATGRALPERGATATCWTIVLDDGIGLVVVSEAKQRANRKIPARKLVEGMVVVSDVRNPAGLLLLPSGTRLTSTTASRLSNLLDVALVEVAG